MKTTFKSEEFKKKKYRYYSSLYYECFKDDFMSNICEEKHDYSDFEKKILDKLKHAQKKIKTEVIKKKKIKTEVIKNLT